MGIRELALISFLALAALSGCGGGADSATVAPPPPGPPPPPPPPPPAAPTATVQQVFTQLPGFSQPVALKQAPGDPSRWFVVEQGGVIRSFANDANASSSTIFVDISALVDSSFGESGLLGMAFHPAWPTTPEVFLSYTIAGPGGGTPLISRVSRFYSADGGQTVLAAPEDVVMEVLQPFGNHNGGDIGFGPNGNLFVGFGDGGSGGDPQDNAQNTSNLLGSIVRINVDGASPYEIPVSNPNFGNALCQQGFGAAACPEIFAWGLRNPWRFSFDSANGNLWTGDVGQGAWEEVDRVEIGQNYGWDDREGAHCFEPMSGCLTSSINPITEYDRSLGASITGGYVYRGAAIADLIDWYVFADFITGRIFAVPEDSQPTVVATELDDTSQQYSAFAEDSAGELYLLHYSGGTIFQLVDAP
jgi:glucose/arabinose dehydrogenase